MPPALRTANITPLDNPTILCDTAKVITIIVAADKNRAIGMENKIPWHIKSDLVRLSKMTRSHTIILGRKSYDSMVWYYDQRGTRMPGACYIVVTRNPAYSPAHQNARVAYSMPDALKLARSLGDDQILVIGGGAIFKEALPFADYVSYTEVHTELHGNIDAYFPPLPMAEWHEASRTHHDQDERDQYATDTIIYERS